MDRLQQLRYVTERYEQLQGLRLIPLGIPFLLSAMWRDGQLAWVPGTHGIGTRIWFLALLVGALAASTTVKTYYRHAFGNVRRSTPLKTPLAGFVFVALLILASAVPTSPEPISIPALVVALGLAYTGVAGGQVRVHYFAVAAFTALFAVLGAVGVPFHARDVLLDQLVGVGIIVIGVGDHLVLRRTLVPVSHVDAV